MNARNRSMVLTILESGMDCLLETPDQKIRREWYDRLLGQIFLAECLELLTHDEANYARDLTIEADIDR